MTRAYALKRLLEHGPMTPIEIAECTRWKIQQVHSVLVSLLTADLIKRSGKHYESKT